jgi:putative transposase
MGALGLYDAARRAAYRELVRHELEHALVDEIRRATSGNFVLGGARFSAQLSSTLGKRVVPGR